MDKVNVQILFTKNEFDKIKSLADAHCLPVSYYLKSLALPDSEFYISYAKLIEKVNMLNPGDKFSIRKLFAEEWTMSKGVKLSLGKIYNSYVHSGIIKNVKEVGKDSSNIMWYEKV